MSRVLDALRNLQQPSESKVVAYTPPTGEKVTPRLAASIRRALLGSQPSGDANPSTSPVDAAPIESASDPVLLFRVPDVTRPAENSAVEQPNSATLETSPELMTTAEPSQPDPLSLVDAIAASLRDVASESPSTASATSPTDLRTEPTQPAEPVVAPDMPMATIQQPQPPAEMPASPLPDREPTPGEQQVFRVLADSRSAQPYRDLARSVRSATRSLASPVVAVLGLDLNDATSFVTAALGALLSAEEGQRVLLLEAHGGTRNLASLYGVPHVVGLCETLTGRFGGIETIVGTSLSPLSVLPFGQMSPEQVLPLSERLTGHVQTLREQFDITLLEAGPLNTPWSIAASRAADVSYLLIRLGDTAAEQAVADVNRFRASGGRVTGCIAIGRETSLGWRS